MKYEYIVYSDVDAAWLRNPFGYLSQILEHYDIAMQTEATEMFPPPFCMGFMAFRARNGAFALLDAFQTAFEADRCANPAATLQVTLNRLVQAEPIRASRIFPLPEALFPNGRLYRLFTRRLDTRDLARQPAHFLFHANWTIGIDAKRDMLRECGMWTPEQCDDLKEPGDRIDELSNAVLGEKRKNTNLMAENDLYLARSSSTMRS